MKLMPGPVKDPLRDLLTRELDSLAMQAAGTETSVMAARIEALNGLAKLIETRDGLQPKPRNWWPAAVLLATLTITSVLLFARITSTEIELDVSLAQLTFTLTKAQAISGALDLSSLGVSGLGDVQLPQSPLSPVPAVSLAASTAGPRHGVVSLSPLLLPADAQVTLAYSDVANQYRLSANAPNLAFEAAVYGPVAISLAGSPSRTVDLTSPKPVLLKGGPTDVSLDLTFSALPQSPLSPQLDVRGIAFSRVDQFLESNQTIVKRLSTILSGTLSFESLNGDELRLRPGEDVRFEKSEGEIRSLECAAKHIDLKFHGRVRGMTAGTGEGRRSIMPTYLEWLKARHGLTLLWGSGVYLFGIAAAALRWFGVRM